MRVAIGVGCRKECSPEEIIELVHKTLEKSDIVISDISVLATIWAKEDAKQIMHAAEALDLPLVVIPQEKSNEVSNMAETLSQKVVELFAVPSVAEVAALAAAGKNPKLVCTRVSSAAATCAIAVGDDV